MSQVRSSEAESSPDGPSPFPTVGVGASAGGLEAVTTLLRHLPPNPGMAFVLVMHLDPHHKSLLPEILERETTLPIEAAVDGVQVQRNHLYVIPPNVVLTIERGRLRVAARSDVVPPFMPIDHFLRSLSQDQGSRAVAVILSGGGTDGALGLDEIKAMNGVTFAQTASTAKHDAMPRSAIGTGSVDYVLAPADIAREIVRVGSLFRDDFDRLGVQGADEVQAYRRILDVVRAATGMDFHQYKPATMSRRIRRRMALAGKEDFAAYAEFLEDRPAEVHALHQDLLIRVTSFFRDPAAYEALREQVFPKLVAGRADGEPIRIWVAGCSTGEEAYSIAILLLEFLGDAAAAASIKILASDVSETALERARMGVYIDNIAMDVSAERLRRFFVTSNGSYRISKTIRDMCVFSRHNLATDTPFANLDLVSCRNVLIYLDASLQKRILPLFHYALKSNGSLLLGTSETVGAFTDLFGALDKDHRIFARKPAAGRVRFDFADVPRERRPDKVERPGGGPLDAGGLSAVQKEADRVLLSRYVPASLVVDEGMNILQFRGQVGPYLNPSSGAASLEVMKMVREGLALELQAAVARARTQGARVKRQDVRFQDEGGTRSISLEVVPLRAAAHPTACFLVLMEEERGLSAESSETPASSGEADPPRLAARLEQELSATRDYLQSVLEENESTNEELKSAHEEILASNEELQSANEEL